MESFDNVRAFGAIDRLFGTGARTRLEAAHVCVVGVGGVGSWAAEALARTGVGRLTFIDMDHVAPSNLNRQVLALTTTIGQSKIEALAARVATINPTCEVRCVDAFVDAENVAQLVPKCDVLIDCIDNVRAKCTLIQWAGAARVGIIVCGAAGGKVDATSISVGDLSTTTHDSLLARVRSELRKKHGFPKTGKMKLRVVSSNEPRVGDVPDEIGAPLACAGYGSLVSVTATMGMVAAGVAIRDLTAPAIRRTTSAATHTAINTTTPSSEWE